MAEKNEPELCDEGIDYAFRKNGVRPSPELRNDLKWTMINILANLIAKHEVAEIKKSVRRSTQKKRRKA